MLKFVVNRDKVVLDKNIVDWTNKREKEMSEEIHSALGFSNVSVKEKRNEEPKLRFYNPFNPNMSSTANAGFNAGTGHPPVDDDPTASHIILEDGGQFYFKDLDKFER
mgnify:CR=1 FL=1